MKNVITTSAAHVTLIAGSCASLHDFLGNVAEARAALKQLIAEALGTNEKDSPAGRALAKAVCDELKTVHGWKQQTASDFLVKECGLRQRADRSDKGTGKGKGEAGENADDAAAAAVSAEIRDALVALAKKLAPESPAVAIRAAYLALKGADAAK